MPVLEHLLYVFGRFQNATLLHESLLEVITLNFLEEEISF